MYYSKVGRKYKTMTREEIRNEINSHSILDYLPDVFIKSKGADMYCCPICGSGTGKNKSGALQIKNNRVMCHARLCFGPKGEDTLGAIRRLKNNCSENEAFLLAGYDPDAEKNQPQRIVHKPIKEYTPEPDNDYMQFYDACQASLFDPQNAEAINYLAGRHITKESMQRFKLGYCASWKHSKTANNDRIPYTKRIIIPRSRRTYTARDIVNKGQYSKQIQGKQTDLFNISALKNASTIVICEGELDAISIMQALKINNVVAIGSITNIKTLADAAGNNPQAVYILALDNDHTENHDSPGAKAQKELQALLEAKGIQVIAEDPQKVYGSYKDANEMLVHDEELLKSNFSNLIMLAEERKAIHEEAMQAELFTRTGAGMLEAFLQDAETEKFKPVITGITGIDKATEGGFMKGNIILLGAAPGMGKTCLAQWIFENMAKHGHDVLYINLEMAREQLLARSLSRYAWNYLNVDLSAIDVMRGYKWTDEQRSAVRKAADIYKYDVANHFIYNPEGTTANLNSIMATIEKETMRIKATAEEGKEIQAPIVCIDYLQLIQGEEREDSANTIKRALNELKNYAMRENTIVFCIMAFNRSANATGAADMDSGRDTSAIEYSADLMLGLAFKAIEDRQTDAQGNVYTMDSIKRLKQEAYTNNTELPAPCRQMYLKAMKGRFIPSERRLLLDFDGKHSTFREIDTRYD